MTTQERKDLRERHNKQIEESRKRFAALSPEEKKKRKEAAAHMQRKVDSSIAA